MNKKVFLIIVAVVMLILAFAWIYLLFFGKPDSAGEIFANLGFGDVTDTATVIDDPTMIDQEPVVAIDTSDLQQLTTRPVVGYGVNNTIARYMEEGTGHIYEIDLRNGTETRITNTTIPRVTSAIFNSAIDTVVFTIHEDQGTTNTIGVITSDTEAALETTTLPLNSSNVAFVDAKTLTYTLTGENTTFYTYDLVKKTTSTLATVPFWSVETIVSEGEVFFMNRFAPNLQGALFSTTPFTALTLAQFGLNGFVTSDFIIYNTQRDGAFVSVASNRSNTNTTNLSLAPLKEKCAVYDASTLYCGAGGPGSLTPLDLKSWYQGTLRMNDYLWLLNLSTGDGQLLILLEATTGRQIDLVQPQFDAARENLLFINKNDNTLWRYEL